MLNAFRSTLEELHDADLLLHVIDGSASDFNRQVEIVENILADLRLDRVPRIFLLNKCDRLEPKIVETLCRRHQAIGVSALHKETLAPILSDIDEVLSLLEEGKIINFVDGVTESSLRSVS